MFYFSRESRINYSLYEEAIKLERYSFDFFFDASYEYGTNRLQFVHGK